MEPVGVDGSDGTVQAIEALAGIASWTRDLRTGQMTWSPSMARLLPDRLNAAAPSWSELLDAVDPQDHLGVVALGRRALRTAEPQWTDVRLPAVDGRVRWLRVAGRVERFATGESTRLIGTVVDVTQERLIAQELQHSRDLLVSVLNAATEQAIIATDLAGVVTVFNTGAERMLGYPAAEMIGRTTDVIHDPVEIRARSGGAGSGLSAFLSRAVQMYPRARQCTYITKTGDRRQVLLTVTRLFGADGAPSGYMKIATDVTEKLLAEAIVESEARFRTTFEYAPSGMMLVAFEKDGPGRLLQVNAALSDLTGYPQEELLTMSVTDLTAPEYRPDLMRKLDEIRSGRRKGMAAEQKWVHAQGREMWVQISMSPRAGDQDHYVVTVVDDITVRKLAEERLTHQTLHDGLTGLPNRLLLTDRITHALAASHRSRRGVGVLYIDLDGFKAVNDSAGHAVGDQVLIQVAQRLLRCLRPGDTVARLGGDEFVAVCPDIDSVDSAITVGERILTSLRAPYEWGTRTFQLGASVGVAVSTVDSSPGQLLHDADRAMYGAKTDGKGRIRIGGSDGDGTATPAPPSRSARSARVEAELAQAVGHGELVMYGQPVVDLTTGRIEAVESLIRWNHPHRGVLEPVEFLDVAEEGVVIHQVGRFAIQESCRIAVTWDDPLGGSAPAIHVNISGRQLESGRLYDEVMAAAYSSGLGLDRLVLEFTELQMPVLATSLRHDIQRLRDHGVRIAIDDLGTGYSSLSRITELPVDILKIDMKFVQGMPTDPACGAVVRGILAMGSALDLDVIAEGVETEEQAELLRNFGCVSAQGYLFAHPVAENSLLEQLLDARQSSSIS